MSSPEAFHVLPGNDEPDAKGHGGAEYLRGRDPEPPAYPLGRS